MLPAVPPRLAAEATLFVLTIISLPGNVGTTVRTTNVTLDTSSHERLKRELQLISVECSFQHAWGELHISGGFCQPTFLCHSLYLVSVIIFENEEVSRADRSCS